MPTGGESGADSSRSAASIQHPRPARDHRVEQPSLPVKVNALGGHPAEPVDVPLGVTGAVKSPTYTLVERYALDSGEAAHLDLYRIADGAELEFLGLDELADLRLCLVEWPERGGTALPPPDLRIALAVSGSGRLARLEPGSGAGETWLAALAQKRSVASDF